MMRILTGMVPMKFTVEEYIRANCEYPREWDGEIKRIEKTGDIFIVVVYVYTCDRSSSFHVVPFMQVTVLRLSGVLDNQIGTKIFL